MLHALYVSGCVGEANEKELTGLFVRGEEGEENCFRQQKEKEEEREMSVSGRQNRVTSHESSAKGETSTGREKFQKSIAGNHRLSLAHHMHARIEGERVNPRDLLAPIFPLSLSLHPISLHHFVIPLLIRVARKRRPRSHN